MTGYPKILSSSLLHNISINSVLTRWLEAPRVYLDIYHHNIFHLVNFVHMVTLNEFFGT